MRSLFGNVDAEALEKQTPPSPQELERRRVGSVAVKSMDRAFVSIEDENRRLHDQLLSAETIIELDPDRIVPSFVSDRLDIDGDESFEAFVEGIREAGQKLPILVRPLSGKPGHYQVAYGHRRLRACQILKRPVKAIVREMSDEELAVSQGIENAARLNLSFIEQALFALKLKELKYSRETISEALGRKDGQRLAYISILTNTVMLIPEDLIRLIGPAPSVGRPKWEKLGAFIKDRQLDERQARILSKVTSAPDWAQAGSDRRFALVLTAFDGSTRSKAEIADVVLGEGITIGVKRTDGATRLSIPDKRLPGLSDWLLERLPQLIADFQDQTGKAGGNK
ncbi:ParB family chromosome partitioning protein [Neorhizobium galegae]|uniref:plasmid partitioning protein RepB n=1 Tax=Neorhizobium galegae TaxID=399 RepID=UPI001FD9EF29|nr:plasmid partitioning protein RepB [Neorhizobium galegae]MBP2551142.1 ParB family chromosome partitioning protein [Neorhizobium galegae]